MRFRREGKGDVVSVVAGHQQGRPSCLPHSAVAGPSPMPGCRFLLFLPKDQHQKHLETLRSI